MDARDGIASSASGRDVAGRIGHGLQGSIALVDRAEIVYNSASDLLFSVLAGTVPKPAPEVVEKRTIVSQPERQEVTVFRSDGSGGFTLSEREVAVTQERNGIKTTSIDKYNATATGKLGLAGQQVRRLETRPDGSEVEVVDVFGAGVGNYSAKPTLREQQIIERKPGPGQTVTESFSIRRPELGSGKLGAAQAISETVCTGKCR